MREKIADDPVCRQHFVFEAEITGGLDHPGIVPVYGLGRAADGRPYYAMALIQGKTLAEVIGHLQQNLTEQHMDDAGRLSIIMENLPRLRTERIRKHPS